MQPVPVEYLYGKYFERVRFRFDLCGTRVEPGGTWLILKCKGCHKEVNGDWLQKQHEEDWTGEFGARVKQNLNTHRSHKNCKTKLVNSLEKDKHFPLTDENEVKDLKKRLAKSEQERLKHQKNFRNLVKAIKKQKLILKRPAMTQPRRLKIAASQHWMCNQCSEELSSCFQIDHIVPWSESFDDSDENLQALCVECHLDKTAEENSG